MRILENIKKKRSQENEFVIWFIIGVAVLILGIIAAMISRSKGVSLIEYVKSLLNIGAR